MFLPRVEPIDPVAFGEEVRRLLREQSLTKTDLARLVGVTPAYISTLLSGRRPVSGAAAARVLHVLRVGADQ